MLIPLVTDVLHPLLGYNNLQSRVPAEAFLGDRVLALSAAVAGALSGEEGGTELMLRLPLLVSP